MIYCELYNEGKQAVFELDGVRNMWAKGHVLPRSVAVAKSQGDIVMFSDSEQGIFWWNNYFPDNILPVSQTTCCKQLAYYFGLKFPVSRELHLWAQALPDIPQRLSEMYRMERTTGKSYKPSEAMIARAVAWLADIPYDPNVSKEMMCGYDISVVTKLFPTATDVQLRGWQEENQELQMLWAYIKLAYDVAFDATDDITLDVGTDKKFLLKFYLRKLTPTIPAFVVELPNGFKIYMPNAIPNDRSAPLLTKYIAKRLARYYLMEHDFVKYTGTAPQTWAQNW